MNRSKIEWTDITWNPITGCRKHCSYCYAEKMAYRLRGRYGYPKEKPFEPTMHWNRLKEPLEVKKPSKIFAVSMGELFGDWVPNLWTREVLGVIGRAHWHIFQILTKQPQNLRFFSYPPNLWLGISIDGLESNKTIRKDLDCLLETNAKIKFASFEPLKKLVTPSLDGLDWIIIGAQTNPLQRPQLHWVEYLVEEALVRNIPVFLKDNLGEIKEFFGDLEEFPE